MSGFHLGIGSVFVASEPYRSHKTASEPTKGLDQGELLMNLEWIMLDPKIHTTKYQKIPTVWTKILKLSENFMKSWQENNGAFFESIVHPTPGFLFVILLATKMP